MAQRGGTFPPDRPRRVAPVTLTRRSLLQASLLAGGGVLLGAGCSSGDSTASTGGGGDGGGKLTLGVGVPFRSFDPYQHLTSNFVQLHTIYDYLVVYTDELDPQPSLAESWEIAPDQRSFTVTLREAAFHSGNPVTAGDIVAGIERARDPERAFNQRGAATIIQSAEAADDRTVTVTLTAPTSEALITDWMNWFPVVEAAGNDPEKLKTTPAGSGPFKLESYTQGTSLVLSRNPDYWDQGLPYLDEVEVRFFDDYDTLVAAVESGDVDGGVYLPSRYVDRLQGRFTITEGYPDALVELFYMNPSLPPFDNKGVRQALARAINRQRIVEQVRFGVSDPVYNGFGTNSPAFDPSYLETYGYDLDAAKELLAAAGGGRSATAAVQPAPGVSESMQIIQADLAKIGFELTIEPMEQTTFVTKLRAGELQCCISATSNTYRSPANIANGSLLVTKDNPLWKGNIPPAYVQAIADARTAVTPEEAADAARRLNEVFAEEAWAVGVATRPSLHAFAKNVTGFQRDTGDHIILTETKVG